MSTKPPSRVDIPEVDVWGLMFESGHHHMPDNHVQYISAESGRSLTIGQVRQTAIRFGQCLRAKWAWKQGDILAFFTPNSIDFPSLAWGCHWAGGVIAPANPSYTPEELAYQLKDCGAKAIVTQRACLDTVVKAGEQIGFDLSKIILMGDDQSPQSQAITLSSFLEGDISTSDQRTKVNPRSDLAFLVYSSGTTGLPKGVMLTHYNVVSNICMLNAVEGPNLKSPNDSMLAVLPFYHIYGLTTLLHFCTYLRLTMVIMASFNLESFCQLVQKYRITYTYLAPPVILHLAKNPVVEKYDVSSLRMITSGGAPLARDLIEAVYERLKIPTKQAYGLSETSPVTHMQTWDTWRTAIGSVGPAVPNLTTKYISLEGHELPKGETGELCIKGPNIFKGYLNKPDATAKTMTPDGFFATGDIGYEDAEGNLFITDRIKELIKYKGFQVAPAELEGLLIAHPQVKDVAVIGVYHEAMATEVPKAYVVTVETAQRNKALAQTIQHWLDARVAPHKRLRGGIEFAEEIPRSTAGKILRRLLRDRAKEPARSLL